MYSIQTNCKVTPFLRSSLRTSSQSGSGLDVVSRKGTGSQNGFLYRSSSLRSPNGQPIPAAYARRRYSPTVLLEILQAPAMARFDQPALYFKRNISLIFLTVNRSWAMLSSLFLEDKHAIFWINQYFFVPVFL
jgi:hypothetical protein